MPAATAPTLWARARRHAAIAIVLALGAVAYFPFTWSDQLGSLGGDNAVYVMTARAYTDDAQASAAAEQQARDTTFPPLYPLLLAAAGGGYDLHRAHAVTTLCLIASAAALYAWMTGIGLSAGLAALAAAAFLAGPGTVLHSLELLSENLFLALSLATLAALARLPAHGAAPAAAALAALAMLTRSAGVALIPALAVAALRHRRSRPAVMRWLPLALLAPVIWSVVHRPERSYGASWLGQVSAGAGHWWEMFAGNVIATTSGALLSWCGQTPHWPIAAIVLVLGLAAAAVRFFRGEPDAWYLGAYVGLVWIWPYPAEAPRLVWVALPIVLGSALWGLAQLLKRVQGLATGVRNVAAALPALVLLLLAAPFAAFVVDRARDPVALETPAFAHQVSWYDRPQLDQARDRVAREMALTDGIRAVGEHVPAGECVFAIKPALAAFFLGRPSFNVPAAKVPEEVFRSELDRIGCSYFLLIPGKSPTHTEVHYPLRRMPDLKVIADYPGPSRPDLPDTLLAVRESGVSPAQPVRERPSAD